MLLPPTSAYYSNRLATDQGTRGPFEVENVSARQIRGTSCISQSHVLHTYIHTYIHTYSIIVAYVYLNSVIPRCSSLANLCGYQVALIFRVTLGVPFPSLQHAFTRFRNLRPECIVHCLCTIRPAACWALAAVGALAARWWFEGASACGTSRLTA